jgi:MFS family permease
MGVIGSQIRSSIGALSGAFRNANIRNLQLAWLCFWGADAGCLVALGVYAFDIGGATAVGLMGLARTVPAALLSPVLAGLLDSHPRERVMIAGLAARAILSVMVMMALFAAWPTWAVFVLAATDAAVSSTYWPAQNALIPDLAQSPEEMTAANVATSTVEGIAVLVGPAVAAAVLALAKPPWVFACGAAALLLATLAALRIQMPEDTRPVPRGAHSLSKFGNSVIGGLRALKADPHSRLVVGLFASFNFVRGTVATLVVVTALDLFGLGNSGVGLLSAASGAGALVGGFGSLPLVGKRALAVPLGLSMIVAGAMLFGPGLYPVMAIGVLCLFAHGIANPVADVAVITLLQRLVPGEVLGRVFGVVEGLYFGPFGVGTIVAAMLINWVGARWALGLCGAALPVLVFLCMPALRRIDEATGVPERQIALLRAIPLFAPLPAQVVEPLARALVPLAVAAREFVVRQGELGDLYYIVDRGELRVQVDGQVVRSLGPGDHFGEIALLKNLPRTASVFATADSSLFSLQRDEFLAAVSGNVRSRNAAHHVADIRLHEHQPAQIRGAGKLPAWSEE